MAKKRQHYIPRFYLNHFIDTDTPVLQTPYVWIFDKKSERIKNKAPLNFAYRHGYNNIIDENGKISSKVEEQFQVIEDKAARIIRKLLNLKYVSKIEREDLAVFIYTMRARIPYFKLIFKEVVENEEYNKQLNDDHIDVNQIESNLAMDSVIRTSFMGKLLLRMFWSVLIAPDNISFITSDNPVIVLDPNAPMLQSIGFATSKDSEIIFPLSPKVCLYGSWIKRKKILEYINKDYTEDINFEIFKYSFKYLYSSTKYIDKRILLANTAVNQGLIK